MNLLPKDDSFFFLFERHSQILCRAAKLLISGLADGYDGVCRIERDISRIEDEGDRVVHDIFGHLRSTFITPFDPEDIQSLATALDDVLDGIEDVTFRIVAYRLKPIPSAVNVLAENISRCCSLIADALVALHQNRPALNYCIEINRLENEARAGHAGNADANFCDYGRRTREGRCPHHRRALLGWVARLPRRSEAQEGGPMALVRDGDLITIDATTNELSMEVSSSEIDARRKAWTAPPLKATRGTLAKYIRAVKSASQGCVTDE
jgi:uncharacterized protein Yka (UPF0111/DUF47 family)